MDNEFLSLPGILKQQLDVLCGADRSVLDTELKIFFRRERRDDEDDSQIIPFPVWAARPPTCAQRRKAA
jgi:hypothetical protein